MRPQLSLFAFFAAALCVPGSARAQHHGTGSSPPTAPHPTTQNAGAAPHTIVPVSDGLGALQFASVNYGVPAPQSLTRQLQDDDDRTRAASLSAIGAPGEYLVRGHIPMPHSVQLEFVSLGAGDELDAILTVELDQHIVSAILLPEDGNWKRIATIIDPTSFNDPTTTPYTFLQLERSLLQPNRYRAIYHATAGGPHGDFLENEAHIRIINSHAVITLSFASSARTCDSPTHPGCEITQRWLQPDPADPAHHFVMVSGTGWLTAKESADPLARSRPFQIAHLRTFTCQPFLYSASTDHFEPTANAAPCPATH
jgi:hypothetical protein